MIRSRAAAFGVSLALVAGSALAVAGPASAKSGVSISVSPTTVHPGRTVGVYASGGDDNFSSYTEVCIERLVTVNHRASWSLLRCTAPTPGYAGGESLRLALRFDRPQQVNLRAQLFSTDSHGGHRVGRQASRTVVVTVR